MPDPIPVMLMGRLAIDHSQQGQGIGRALLKDAILRTLKAAEIAGIRALLVHALDEQAASFYLHIGFMVSPIDPLVLMLPLDTARKAIE
jgi:GNAT superfamily N-acetyltransferase